MVKQEIVASTLTQLTASCQPTSTVTLRYSVNFEMSGLIYEDVLVLTG